MNSRLITLLVAVSSLVARQSDCATDLNRAESSNRQRPNTRCETEACQKVANLFLESIDFDTNPCDDFYQFACGKHIHNGPNGRTRTAINSFQNSINSIVAKINNMVENEQTYPTDSRDMQRIRSFYTSCISRAGSNAEDILRVIRNLGGFPLLADQTGWQPDDTSSWIDRLSAMRQTGLSDRSFFELTIKISKVDRGRRYVRIASIDTSNWTEARMEDEMQKYQHILNQLSLGQNVLNSQIDRQLRRMYRFRVKLAKIYSSIRIPFMNISFHVMMTRVSQIDWPKLFDLMIPIPFSSDTMFMSFDLIPILADLLDRTDPEVLANHMMMHALEELLAHLGPEGDRREHCDLLSRSLLGHAISNEYLRHYVAPGTREGAFGLAELMRRQFTRLVANSPWISDSSKVETIDKLARLRLFVGHSEKFIQQVEEDLFYNGVVLKADDLLENYLALMRESVRRMLDLAAATYEDSIASEVDGIIMSNLISYNYDNTIYTMVGILNDYFLDLGRPSYVNAATFGSMVAHEMAHAFDPTFVVCDRQGEERIWWDKDTELGYRERLRCFRNRYDGIELPEMGLRVDGQRTLNENLADNIGLNIAHSAYLAYSNDRPPELLLPNLNFNQDQLFWVSNAILWCDDNELLPEGREKLRNGVYSPNKLRVNVPFANKPEFAQAFNCPLGSPMNPRHKCQVFD